MPDIGIWGDWIFRFGFPTVVATWALWALWQSYKTKPTKEEQILGRLNELEDDIKALSTGLADLSKSIALIVRWIEIAMEQQFHKSKES